MYILKGLNGRYAELYDTNTNKSRVESFQTIKRVLSQYKSVQIVGLQVYDTEEIYPIDSRIIDELGLVILPDEAIVAMRKIRRERMVRLSAHNRGGVRGGRERKEDKEQGEQK